MSQQINEMWNSAYWKEAQAETIANIQDAKARGNLDDVAHYLETLALVCQRIARTTVEEVGREFWTESHWLIAEDRAREHLAHVSTTSEILDEHRAEIVASAESEVAFYQRERAQRFETLLQGVNLS